MNRSTRLGAGLALSGLIAGLLPACSHLPARPPTSGQSAVDFVEPPPPASQKSEALLDVSEETARFRAPVILSDLVVPAYPASALVAHAGAATIDVQLTVGIAGQITDVSPNAVDLAVLGRFAAVFEDAIEAAVAQWRFRPAELVHLERGTDPQHSYLRITSTEKVPAQLEAKFRFNESGMVSVDPNRQ